ncbi:MAG: PAS domain S-box protein, partial [Gemmatimonadetes bacterium]|nr:PAS domain S-box protein [Gemmatimonadota bacterium]
PVPPTHHAIPSSKGRGVRQAESMPDPRAPSRETDERDAALRRGEARALARAEGRPEPRDRYHGRSNPEVAQRAFATLAENVRDFAIFLTDPQGIITFWGEGARLIKRWTKDEAEGAHLRLLYPPGGSEDGTAEEHLLQAAESGEYIGEGHRVRGDCTLFWAGISLTALRDSDGTLLGFAKVTRDLTTRRAEAATRAAAYEQVEEASRLRGDLLEQMTRAREEVEQRVAQRTEELRAASARLQAEMEERTRIENARNEVLRQLVAVEEQERLRVSRELHDQMAQLVTALLLGLRTMQQKTEPPPPGLTDVQRIAEQIARAVHLIASELRPPALDRLGLRQTLHAHLDEWSQRYGVEAEFQAIGIDAERFAPEVETTLFRAVQEGLTNVAKHANARCVSLILERRPGSVGVILEDDGRGFEVEEATVGAIGSGRLGLLGMRERIELLGGRLEIESAPGSGASIFARLPDLPVPADSSSANGVG